MRKTIKNLKFIALGLIFTFLVNTVGFLPLAQAQDFVLPKPGTMVSLSLVFAPPMLKGIKVHTDNPFRFDFILDKGDSPLGQDQLKKESSKLIKYFLASLTIPEKDLWVNLSPYEKDRIVPESFGQTEMGRDLLAEDYMLKQITASLIYPEGETGKKFWKRIYEEAAKKFGTTNIPLNTFNKVWIVPEKAVVYENAKAGTVYVIESKLKVMLEQDYLSLEKNGGIQKNVVVLSPAKDLKVSKDSSATPQNDLNALGSQIIHEILIPELTKEINEGKNFSQLRQVYNSLILAAWYKKKIKDSILEQVYSDKNKIAGINIDDPNEKRRIYERYLQAFKKGAYNYIKEDVDPVSQESVARKYFSGGVNFAMAGNTAMKGIGDLIQSTSFPSGLNDQRSLLIVEERTQSAVFGLNRSIPNFAMKSNINLDRIIYPVSVLTRINEENIRFFLKELAINLSGSQEFDEQVLHRWAKENHIESPEIRIKQINGQRTAVVLYPHIGAQAEFYMDGNQMSVRHMEYIYRSDLNKDQEELLLGRKIETIAIAKPSYFKNKTILITGAAGTVGEELVQRFLELSIRKLILIDRSNFTHLDELKKQFRDKNIEIEVHQLDITDKEAMEAVIKDNRPDFIYHLAAFKYADLGQLEINQREVRETNVDATRHIIAMADKYGVGHVIIATTDKSSGQPTNFYGQTKKEVEDIVQEVSLRSTRVVAVRFHNILGSRGSLIPIISHQLDQGYPIVLFGEHSRRYFISVKQAGALLINTTLDTPSNSIVVIKAGQEVEIKGIIERLAKLRNKELKISIAPLRPGEKIQEELITSEELSRASDQGDHWVIKPNRAMVVEENDHVWTLADIPKVFSSGLNKSFPLNLVISNIKENGVKIHLEITKKYANWYHVHVFIDGGRTGDIEIRTRRAPSHNTDVYEISSFFPIGNLDENVNKRLTDQGISSSIMSWIAWVAHQNNAILDCVTPTYSLIRLLRRFIIGRDPQANFSFDESVAGALKVGGMKFPEAVIKVKKEGDVYVINQIESHRNGYDLPGKIRIDEKGTILSENGRENLGKVMFVQSTNIQGYAQPLNPPDVVIDDLAKNDAMLADDHIQRSNFSKNTGGIDLTSHKFIQTKNAGLAIKFHLDPAQLAQLQNVPGFVPVIINIKPMTNLRRFLGVQEISSGIS